MANYHGRKSLDLGLLEIETKINALDLKILEVFEDTFSSFYEKDLEKSKKVIKNDYLINKSSLEIENNSIEVIRRETPLASDMRKLTSYMFVSQELERIGDYLSGICKINLKIGKEPFITKFEKIPKMEAIAKNMLKDSIKLFSNVPEEKKAIKAARKIFSQDDEIDYLNYQVQNDLIKRMSRDSKLVEQGTYIIWVAHNLERISDRANNIAERTIYVITGDSGAIVPYELEE
ncbi:MAG: phosphate transport system regulatory protein PhoU [Dehalococcoidia bacterium]|nr:phosphate transport system regulatory protein PhoU [Dehalococcoidia bacterium]MEC7920843.1 phosphate signaling complex protein PhoU [Chloroflexota bacterium]MEC9451052.1 phosphate signaling complex protein PhoU [Chloroflexota bacterium]|tara:strand:+ start:892 stop:1590 length:699 start_codon:yes stop_codon:yes gene_type:complete